MSENLHWIAAEGDERDPGHHTLHAVEQSRPEADWVGVEGSNEMPLPSNFPAEWLDDAALNPDYIAERNPDLWLYRDRTVGLLRRFLRFSLETGRLPSFVGREFFRARVTSYTAVTFEDRVIFVHDVEKCLGRLTRWDQDLVGRIIMQEHSQEKTARLLHCSRKTVQRRLEEVLDLLSEDFLRIRLLVALPARPAEQECPGGCQEAARRVDTGSE